MSLRVIALGQRLSGDDGAGMAVFDEIERQNHHFIDLKKATDASALVELLQTPLPVVIVDALLVPEERREPGRIHSLSLGDLEGRRIASVSTHGLDVGAAIELARELFPLETAPSIQLIGIELEKAGRFSNTLSPSVRAAIPSAVNKILEIALQSETIANH